MATDKLVDFDHVTDYISREAAYKTLTEYYHHSSGVQHTVLREALNRVPTADVRPVVHAHWTDHRTVEHDGEWYCSACGKAITIYMGHDRVDRYSYCPNCGADMRGDAKCEK